MKIQLLIAAQIAALTAAAGIASAAFAGPLDPMPGAPGGHGPVKVMVIVSSHGLDLTSDEGAGAFLERLTTAVNRACDDRPSNGPTMMLSHTSKFYDCRSQALETAMAYVHSPVVKRQYAAIQAKDGLRLARR